MSEVGATGEKLQIRRNPRRGETAALGGDLRDLCPHLALRRMKAAKLPASLSVSREALAAEVRSRQREIWLAENQEAIAAYNEHVAQNGVWSEGRRGF